MVKEVMNNMLDCFLFHGYYPNESAGCRLSMEREDCTFSFSFIEDSFIYKLSESFEFSTLQTSMRKVLC